MSASKLFHLITVLCCSEVIIAQYIEIEVLRDDVIAAREEVEQTCARERNQLIFRKAPSRASAAHFRFNAPTRRSVLIQQKARTLSAATKRQSRKGTFRSFAESNRLLNSAVFRQLPERQCVRQSMSCNANSRFRTLDGTCNNLNRPDFGSSGSPFQRLLSPVYNDGQDAPRSTSSAGSALPSPRLISRMVHDVRDRRDRGHSQMLMQWGQFLDHDLTLTPESTGCGGEELECSDCNSSLEHSDCFPIPIPSGDPIFSPSQCMNFRRSLAGQLTLGAREQINQLTAFIDASNVYGSSDEDARNLRSSSGGQLRLQNNGLLPTDNTVRTCSQEATSQGLQCFAAGDARVNVQLGLMSIHTLWAHQHNTIARKLSRINPHWNDERLYQEARRIVGAMHQHITYNEFLAQVLGPETMRRYNLRPLSSGFFTGYDSSCDATLFNEFSTAAYRFGHSLVDERFRIINDGGRLELWNLTGHFMDPSRLYQSPSFQNILAGISGQRCQHADRFVANALRNHLFGSGVSSDGLDLIALNIHRGRDHGLQPYVRYRARYNLPVPRSFADLHAFMASDTVGALRRVYQSVDDIDLFSGLLCENTVPNGLVGPLAANILGEQFSNLKKCDRFFYENSGQPGSFTSGQLREIRKATMRNSLCLQQPTRIAGLNCASNGGVMNLELWRDNNRNFGGGFRNTRRFNNNGRQEKSIDPRCF